MIEADVLLHLSKKAVSKSATELDFDNGKTVMFAKSKNLIKTFSDHNAIPISKQRTIAEKAESLKDLQTCLKK